MILFEAEISVDGHGSKKNSKNLFVNRRTGRTFITSSNKAKVAEASMVAELGRRRIEYTWLPIRDPVIAKFTFIYPKDEFYTKKGQRSKNLPDISNLYELPQDALQSAGILENDRLIRGHDGSRILWGPARKIIVELSKFSDPEEYQD